MSDIRHLFARSTAMLTTVAWATCCRAADSLPLVLAQEAGMTVTKDTKNYIVEILVTVALFGLALWVVCRSSRRV